MEFRKCVTATIMDGEVVRWAGIVSWANFPESGRNCYWFIFSNVQDKIRR